MYSEEGLANLAVKISLVTFESVLSLGCLRFRAFRDLKVGRVVKKCREKVGKRNLRNLTWIVVDKIQRVTKENKIDLFSTDLLKLRQYLCMFIVRQDKRWDWECFRRREDKSEDMAACIVNMRLLFPPEPK